MQSIIHPSSNRRGLPPEDTFQVLDDMGQVLGEGYVIYQYQPHLDPQFPVNIFFQMSCTDERGRFMLLGALAARARQMRDQMVDAKGRLYTILDEGDAEMEAFYRRNGMNLSISEGTYLLRLPIMEPRIPMSMMVDEVPLATVEDQMAFLSRLHQHDIDYLDLSYLQTALRQPHAHLLCVRRTDGVVAEMLISGTGERSEIVAFYTIQGFRGQGVAKALLYRSMMVLQSEGVMMVTTRLLTRSEPQMHLLRFFQGEELRRETVFPSIEL